MSAKKNKIVVYEHDDYKGLSREFTSDIKELRDFGFGDCISSLKVIGQPWVVYENPDFGGWLQVYEEGEYPKIEMQDTISSLRLITSDLRNPQITLYENMEAEEEGEYWLGMGETLADYGIIGFNDQVSHLRPLKAGRPVVKSKVLWDQMKKENEICSLLDEIIGVNKTDFEQEFTSSRSKEYESASTYDFKFSNTTTIEFGVEFECKLIGAVSTRVSNSLTVESGKSETITKRDKIELTMPTKLPPHTKMTLRVVRKECTTIVPVELTVEQNEKKLIEYGELRCEMGNSVTAEYTSEKV
ncbi:epidermal differentiation-specific protein-like [Rhinatrema bivittatum]|uniref:epidermal differentiation-specific protein-like n=1 Tax=Rhinatrema bivittatum TaxID=194408 RepID=UPI00112E1158|nr:epidermal differentiation-specific protein-like [Rhinatrema bivittatum]